jgi:hypothetical protein
VLVTEIDADRLGANGTGGRKRRRKPYTGFGKAVRTIMIGRDVPSWTVLEELIVGVTGRRYSHQSMSKYAIGKVVVPPGFVQDFAATLDLSEAERWELAYQYAYHCAMDEDDD